MKKKQKQTKVRKYFKKSHWNISVVTILGCFIAIFFIIQSQNTTKTVLGTSTINVSASIYDTNGKIPQNFLGTGGDFLGAPDLSTQLTNTIASLHPQIIRYPGGEQSNYWDWQQGDWNRQVNSFTPLPKSWNDPHNTNTLDNLKTLIDKTHATPLFVLNMLTAGANKQKACGKMGTWNSDWQAALNDQIAFLKSAQAKGLPIKYVELGNELYVNDKSHSCVFASGAGYGKIATYWVKALHNTFPDVKVALDANYNYASDIRAINWNNDLFHAASGYDSLTIHVYPGTGLPANGTTTCDKQKIEYQSLQSQDGIAKFLGTPFATRSSYERTLRSFPSNKTVWITETNVWDDPANAVYGTWAHGLFMGTLALQYLENPTISQVDIYSVKGGAEFSEIFANTNGFYKRCDTRPATIQYGTTAEGTIMQKIAVRMSGMYGFGKFTFSTNPLITRGFQSYNALNGYMFSNGPKHTAVIFNLSANNINLTLPSNALSTYNTFEQLSADPAMLARGDVNPHYNTHNSLKHDFGNIDDRKRTVFLHPYSVTFFIMSKTQ